MACFPNSLATKLGVNYVAKTLDWFLADNTNKFLFHIEIENEIVGYCGGFIPKGNGDGSTSGMLQHAFKQAVFGVAKKPWLLINTEIVPLYPIIIKNIQRKLSSLFNKKKPQINQINTQTQKHSGLVVIGVLPAYRGKGIYNELMEYFFLQSKQKNATYAQLSVKKDNDRGIGAYKKFGWQIDKEEASTFVLKKIL